MAQIAGGRGRWDAKSAHIAAASVVAKVTRDALMMSWDASFPAYGFKTAQRIRDAPTFLGHRTYGPSPIHRRSFAPVRLQLEAPLSARPRIKSA